MAVQAPRFRSVPVERSLFQAVREKDSIALSSLLKRRNANPNCRSNGEPLLVYATRTCFHKGMEKILAHSWANPNRKDRRGDAALHIAAEKGDLVAVKILVNRGAHINIRERKGYTPLHIAIRREYEDIVEFFLSQKKSYPSHHSININARCYERKVTPLLVAAYGCHFSIMRKLLNAGARFYQRDVEGLTAKALTVFNVCDDVNGILPMDAYTEEFVHRKALAHCFGFGGESQIGRTTFPLDGACSPFMHKMIYNQLDAFFQRSIGFLSPNDKKEILSAFALSDPSRPVRLVAEDIQNRRLVVVQAGWSEHAIDLVFYQNYLAICNRGEGVPNNHSSLEVFKIDSSIVSPEIVNEILDQKFVKRESASSYFYFTLPLMLNDKGGLTREKDSLCNAIERFSPKYSKKGTCTFAAAKAAMRVAIMLVKMVPTRALNYRTIAALSVREAKNASTLGRILELEDYLKSHTSKGKRREQPDLNLIKSAYDKAQKHVDEANDKGKDICEWKLRLIRNQYDHIFRDTV